MTKMQIFRPTNNAYLFGIFTDRELSLEEYERARLAAVDALSGGERVATSFCSPLYLDNLDEATYEIKVEKQA